MKKTNIILALLLFPLAIIADGWDEGLYKQIESRIIAPTFNESTYNITKYGASTKATAAKNQKAILKAIDLCSKKAEARSLFRKAHS